MESDLTKKWSIGEAEDTVKAVFLMNANNEDELPKLRYTDILVAINAQGRTISPKMLTKALDSLGKKREITSERSELDSREKFYSLVPLGREQVIKLMSSMDVARISKGKSIGAIADPDEGWSYYSVPIIIRNRVRPRLRIEAKAFKKNIEEILDDEADQLLDDLEKKAKGRVDKKQLQEGLEACALLLFSAEEVGKIESLLLFYGKLIEELMPGSAQLFESIGGKVVNPQRTLVTRIYGLTDEDYDESMKISEATRAKIGAVFEKLAPKDQKRFAERLASLMVLRSSMCAVVHL